MNPLDVFTAQAQSFMGNEASQEHYRRLAEGELCATKCDACSAITFPPRSHCPDCFGDQVSWVPIGEGATLYAFTTQGRALRFRVPAVVGIVDGVHLGDEASARREIPKKVPSAKGSTGRRRK